MDDLFVGSYTSETFKRTTKLYVRKIADGHVELVFTTKWPARGDDAGYLLMTPDETVKLGNALIEAAEQQRAIYKDKS